MNNRRFFYEQKRTAAHRTRTEVQKILARELNLTFAPARIGKEEQRNNAIRDSMLRQMEEYDMVEEILKGTESSQALRKETMFQTNKRAQDLARNLYLVHFMIKETSDESMLDEILDEHELLCMELKEELQSADKQLETLKYAKSKGKSPEQIEKCDTRYKVTLAQKNSLMTTLQQVQSQAQDASADPTTAMSLTS